MSALCPKWTRPEYTNYWMREDVAQAPPDTPGFRMSPEHWWWQRGIAQYFASLPGVRTEIEYSLNGKRIDVAVIRGSAVHAYEVEMAPDNAVRNAKADLEAGAEKITIACRDVRVARLVGERLAGVVSGSELERIRLLTLAELPIVEYLLSKGKRAAFEPDGLFAEKERQDSCHTSDKSRALVISEKR